FVPFSASPQVAAAVKFAVPLLVNVILFSVMLLLPRKSAPFCVEFCIVPPFDVKLPVRFETLIPVPAPLLLIEIKLSVPVLPLPVMLTTVPVVEAMIKSAALRLVFDAAERPVLVPVETLIPRTERAQVF